MFADRRQDSVQQNFTYAVFRALNLMQPPRLPTEFGMTRLAPPEQLVSWMLRRLELPRRRPRSSCLTRHRGPRRVLAPSLPPVAPIAPITPATPAAAARLLESLDSWRPPEPLPRRSDQSRLRQEPRRHRNPPRRAERGGRHAITPEPGDAETVIVNTCAFIDEAKRESIDAILEVAARKGAGGRQAAGGRLPRPAVSARTCARDIPEIDGFISLDSLLDVEPSSSLGGATPPPSPSHLVFDHTTPRR